MLHVPNHRSKRRATAWTQPGAWSDCDAANTWSVSVPNTGTVLVPVLLPASVITNWLGNGGAANYGLLLRYMAGVCSVG